VLSLLLYIPSKFTLIAGFNGPIYTIIITIIAIISDNGNIFFSITTKNRFLVVMMVILVIIFLSLFNIGMNIDNGNIDIINKQ